MKEFRNKLPEKRRKNAVVGAQVIFSFSHELLQDKNFKPIKYFAEWPSGKAASSHGVSCRFDSDLCNFGALAHSGEHLFCKQKAAGSKPAGSIQIMSSEAKDLWGSLSP